MSAAYFVTGTDTEIGKTTIAAGLLCAARRVGLSTAAAKPVASGCQLTTEGLRNDDALALLAQCSLPLRYDEVNPLAFAPAIATPSGRSRCWRGARGAGAAKRGSGDSGKGRGFHPGRGRRWLARAPGRQGHAGRSGPGLEYSGDSGGRCATGLHQPRAAERRRHSRRWPDPGRLGGQCGRPECRTATGQPRHASRATPRALYRAGAIPAIDYRRAGRGASRFIAIDAMNANSCIIFGCTTFERLLLKCSL